MSDDTEYSSNDMVCKSHPSQQEIEWANDMLQDLANEQVKDSTPTPEDLCDYYKSIAEMEA